MRLCLEEIKSVRNNDDQAETDILWGIEGRQQTMLMAKTKDISGMSLKELQVVQQGQTN